MLSSRTPTGPLGAWLIGSLPVALPVVAGAAALVQALVPSTLNDTYQPGIQPSEMIDPIVDAGACYFCHANYDPDDAPFERWAGSMMANSMRDPIFHAALAIAEQDAANSGELCLRCHSPGGWLGGRSTPTDGSSLFGSDYQGVSCNFCHRMVDPFDDPANPAFDAAILANMQDRPLETANGKYIVDPLDRRRGPFEPDVCNLYHPETSQSPFHQESGLCATCHEVSNPLFKRVGGATPTSADTYVLDDLDTPHPTQSRFDEFPLERTYSEWLLSDFAQAPIDMQGRFGGNKNEVSSCQDCHMPDTTGSGCSPIFKAPIREDLPQHDLAGANSWVPLAVHELDQTLALYGAAEATGLPQQIFQDSVDRNISMLQRAADMELSTVDGELNVRIVNQGGHKLPTGYPEGRRMWIQVRFYDAADQLVQVHGAYDPLTAQLTEADTKVYEKKIGPDADLAATSGEPAAPSFHFAFSNKVYKDNRIPPRGFDNAAFEAHQAAPVGATYADGQYWDDTLYPIPCDAVRAEVSLFHQTTTKEYIEFLRDENVTNNAGQIAYDLWVQFGKSAPVEMTYADLDLPPRLTADVTEISVSTGGIQSLCLSAGPANAGLVYWVLGSESGSVPGTTVDGVNIPLNFDSWSLYTLTQPNIGPLYQTLGMLDASGGANAQLIVPVQASLAGVQLHHAYLLTNGSAVLGASNAVPLSLVP
jgi:hypothetical protein